MCKVSVYSYLYACMYIRVMCAGRFFFNNVQPMKTWNEADFPVSTMCLCANMIAVGMHIHTPSALVCMCEAERERE